MINKWCNKKWIKFWIIFYCEYYYWKKKMYRKFRWRVPKDSSVYDKMGTDDNVIESDSI